MLPDYLLAHRDALEEESRRLCLAVPVAGGSLLCRVLGRYLMYADPADRGIAPHLCLDGYWESWITLAIARALQAGWHCIDVGANHGYYSVLMAAAVGREGRVLAVEPNAALADLAERTLEVNGFSAFSSVARVAATDADGEEAQLHVVPGHALLGSVVPDMIDAPGQSHCGESHCGQSHRGESHRGQSHGGQSHPGQSNRGESHRVETLRVDTLTADWPRVDLVKIDAEGAEDLVWRGMTRTLARNPDIVVVLEFTPARYRDPAAFVAAIQAAGFTLRYVRDDGDLAEVAAAELARPDEAQRWWMLYLRRA